MEVEIEAKKQQASYIDQQLKELLESWKTMTNQVEELKSKQEQLTEDVECRIRELAVCYQVTVYDIHLHRILIVLQEVNGMISFGWIHTSKC